MKEFNHIKFAPLFLGFHLCDMPAAVKELIMLDGNLPKDGLLWVVAAALINPDGKVLVQKRAENRSMAGLWEFPGGKIEPNERPEDALVRELYEELGISLEPEDLQPISFASAPLGKKHLILLLYVCQKWLGVPAALDAEAIQWWSINALQDLEMPPADVPLVKALLAHALAVPNPS